MVHWIFLLIAFIVGNIIASIYWFFSNSNIPVENENQINTADYYKNLPPPPPPKIVPSRKAKRVHIYHHFPKSKKEKCHE